MGFGDTRFDAVGSSIWLQQELDRVAQDDILTDYPARLSTSLLPRSRDVSPGQQSVTYRHIQDFGVAKIVALGADFPLVEVSGMPVTKPIRIIRDGWKYDEQEVQIGQFAGRMIDGARMRAAYEAVEALMDEIAFIGDPTYGLDGLVTHPNVLRMAALYSFDAANTAAQILSVANAAHAKIGTLSRGIEKPTTWLMPDDVLEYIGSVPYAAGSDSSILQIFKNGHPNITRIEGVHWLTGAGAGGTDVMMFLTPTKNKVELLRVSDPRQSPPSWVAPNFTTMLTAETGGVAFHKPFSAIIVEGV